MLQIQIAQAKNEADYTPASWAAFKAVLDEVVAGRDALSTQTDINAAKARLEQAIEGLVAKSSLNVDALSDSDCFGGQADPQRLHRRNRLGLRLMKRSPAPEPLWKIRTARTKSTLQPKR